MKRSGKIGEEKQRGRGITGSSNLKFYGRSSVVRQDSEESVPFVGPVADYRRNKRKRARKLPGYEGTNGNGRERIDW